MLSHRLAAALNCQCSHCMRCCYLIKLPAVQHGCFAPSMSARCRQPKRAGRSRMTAPCGKRPTRSVRHHV